MQNTQSNKKSRTLAGRLVVLALALGSALFVAGCEDDAKNAGRIPGELKSESGITYKIVTIEGRKFVATQSAYGYWTLAGPIDR